MSEIFEEYYNIDSHSILRNVSVELIIEYLREQFTDPYNLSTRNYVDEFIGDYEYSKNALVSDNENNADIDDFELEEELEKIEGYRSKFVSFVRDQLYQLLSIGLPDLEERSIKEQNKILSVVYRYFILNIRRNFLNLCKGYIEEHKNDLAKTYKRSADITALAQKNRVADNRDLVILSSLPEILRDIMNIEFPIDEFVEHTYGTETPEYDALIMKELIDKDIVTGNFVPHYKKLVDDYLLSDIEFNIKSSILDSYKAQEG